MNLVFRGIIGVGVAVAAISAGVFWVAAPAREACTAETAIRASVLSGLNLGVTPVDTSQIDGGAICFYESREGAYTSIASVRVALGQGEPLIIYVRRPGYTEEYSYIDPAFVGVIRGR